MYLYSNDYIFQDPEDEVLMEYVFLVDRSGMSFSILPSLASCSFCC